MNPNQQTIKTYDKIAQSYSQINFERDFWLDEFKFFGRIIPGKRVLDIGCGAGRDALLFTIHGFDYTGIDASKEMLRKARETAHQGKFKRTDVYKLRVPKIKYDGFWASASLLHIPKKDLPKILRKLRSTIKKDGGGFISLKPKDKMDEETVLDKRYAMPRFFAYYKKPEFKKMLEQSGFKLIKVWEKLELRDNKIWLCFFVKPTK